MKRQNPSNNKSILHFFKTAPRGSQESTTATADTSADDALRLPTPSGALPNRAQTSIIDPTLSFGSNTSTIADAPTNDQIMTSTEIQTFTTSQTSANSGVSRRVVSNGQQIVLNSDSDSDSDLMGELDFGLPAPKPSIPTHTSRSSRPSHMSRLDEPELRRPPKAGRRSDKRPFSQLMEAAQRNLETEREIQEHKADLEKPDEQPAPIAMTLDKDALKHAINDDEDSDQADRLYKAMQRTNEVHSQITYHFFDGDNDTPNCSQILPFPQQCLPEHRWTACFKEPSTRDQAFMTGFAHQIFCLQELPDELAAWMGDQICLGGDPGLDERYLEILTMHHEVFKRQLNSKRLDVMFKSIGARIESLDTNEEISPSGAQANSARPLPPSLKRIAALLTAAAPWLHIKARTHAFHLLCNACLDDRVLLDTDVLDPVQDAIEAIVCQYADNHKLTSGLAHVIPKLLSRVTNPLLQANLIRAFPTKSPLTAYLQRHLALSFLFHPTAVDVALADVRLPGLLHTQLESSPHFRMCKDTNYSFVVARLTLLDIAVGPGPLTVPYLPLISPPPSEAGSPPPAAPMPASFEVKEFNKEVDALAQHVKLLGNSIIETGAALDLTILEAKERCERVYWRLQHAVRIGGKKVDNVFGENEEEKQLKLGNFFKSLPKKNALKAKESVFDADMDTELSA